MSSNSLKGKAFLTSKACFSVTMCMLILVAGCDKQKLAVIRIENSTSKADSLFVSDIITGQPIARVSLKEQNDQAFRLDEITLTSVSLAGKESSWISIFSPGQSKSIWVEGSMIRSNSLADSIANYMLQSTNEMFGLHGDIIFGKGGANNTRPLFDSLISARSVVLNRYVADIPRDEFELLSYQNKARAYSFLMFYGRIAKRFSPKTPYFNFIDSVDAESIYAKSLPEAVLYKFEIEYLRKHDSIRDLASFMDYIETRTLNNDLEDYYKMSYLRSVFENPAYWKKHEQLFTTSSIEAAIEREKSNPYRFMTNSVNTRYFSSLKGVEAFNFTALRRDSSQVKLEDFKGKVVVIDVWATWCGPCILHRPRMLELAAKYRNMNVVVLMVSVDSSIDTWRKFLVRTNPDDQGSELFIADGIYTEFGRQFNIMGIPKYILLDPDGKIVTTDIAAPSIAMQQLIESELAKFESH
jgi:thiol-disulfide isomerase/thioredoxin